MKNLNKELNNKNTQDLHELLHKKGINWNNYTSGEKRGRVIMKQTYALTCKDKMNKEVEVIRNRWLSFDGTGPTYRYETPIFTQSRDFLRTLIPRISEVNFELENAK